MIALLETCKGLCSRNAVSLIQRLGAEDAVETGNCPLLLLVASAKAEAVVVGNDNQVVVLEDGFLAVKILKDESL
jgi:hypothetical protein